MRTVNDLFVSGSKPASAKGRIATIQTEKDGFIATCSKPASAKGRIATTDHAIQRHKLFTLNPRPLKEGLLTSKGLFALAASESRKLLWLLFWEKSGQTVFANFSCRIRFPASRHRVFTIISGTGCSFTKASSLAGAFFMV